MSVKTSSNVEHLADDTCEVDISTAAIEAVKHRHLLLSDVICGILSRLGKIFLGAPFTLTHDDSFKTRYSWYFIIFYSIGIMGIIFATIDGTFFEEFSHFSQVRYQSMLCGLGSMVLYIEIIRHVTKQSKLKIQFKSDQESQHFDLNRSALFMWNHVFKIKSWSANNYNYNKSFKGLLYFIICTTGLSDILLIGWGIYFIAYVRISSGIIWLMYLIFCIFPVHLYVTCMIFSFWYQALICSELKNDLKCILSDIRGKNDKNMLDWYKNVYCQQFEFYEQCIFGKFDSTLTLSLIISLIGIWVGLSTIFNSIFDVNATGLDSVSFIFWIGVILILSIFIGVNIMFLCQSTKDNGQMVKLIDQIAMTNAQGLYIEQEMKFWWQCMQCKTGMGLHLFSGRIYKYTVSWSKMFRVTVVFGVSKVVVYFVTSKLQN